MRLGNPAFGWMASGRPPASGTMRSRTSYSVEDPTEQFAPMACTASPRRCRATSAGVRPMNVTASSVKAIWATMGRSVTERIASMAVNAAVRFGYCFFACSVKRAMISGVALDGSTRIAPVGRAGLPAAMSSRA